MPVNYAIDTERKLIRTRCTGFVTFEEVSEHFRELRLDPKFTDRFDVLLDLSECASVPSEEQLRAMVPQMDAVSGGWRFGACAIIVANDELYGVSRMLEVYAENVFSGTEVFRSAEEGDRWLASLQQMRQTSS
jgi:hypothetical protein